MDNYGKKKNWHRQRESHIISPVHHRVKHYGDDFDDEALPFRKRPGQQKTVEDFRNKLLLNLQKSNLREVRSGDDGPDPLPYTQCFDTILGWVRDTPRRTLQEREEYPKQFIPRTVRRPLAVTPAVSVTRTTGEVQADRMTMMTVPRCPPANTRENPQGVPHTK